MNEMQPRIFVNIAAYRDRDCVNTIEDLFSKARWPDRLFVGVCWQSLSPDDDDIDPLGRHADRCRILLVEHWDETVLAMLADCPSERPILSNYPAAFTPPDQIDSHVVSVINAAGFDGDGVMKLGSEGHSPEHVPDQPQPSAFCGAGFVFGPSAWITDVPYDPYLYFQGEEITLAVRLFTQGWDIFCPSDVLSYHDYNARPDRPRHWVDRRDWPELNKRSVQRVRHLLGMEESRDPEVLREVGRYGLGSRRSLADYEAMTGINFRARTINGRTTAEIEAQQPPDQKRKRTADAFTALWRDNGWGSAETRSGTGSTLAATETLRANLSELCRFLGVRQLIDAGCGDCNWAQAISAQFELYLGLDVVPGLIAETDQRFGSRRGHFFAVRDVALDDLPRADAILCRDVLTHLSNEQALAALGHFWVSGSRFLFATTQRGADNHDIPTGDWRPLDLTREPFDLPQPMLTIDENGDGTKLLGVWALKDLPERLRP
jgi:hypothetical protein